MKKFMLITNNEKKKNIDSAKLITELIEKRGGKVSWSVMPAPTDISPMPVEEGTSAIITIGGDGTMVRSAQRTLGSKVPLIGVNRGHLGYLCDVSDENLEDAMDRIVAGNYTTQDRMMLAGQIKNADEDSKKSFFALNDIVLKGKNDQAVIRVSIYVNDTFLYAFDGDGIIIATPTGSTAYNLSANGPIADPGTELMLLTPINPHTLNTRSVILDSGAGILLRVESRRSTRRECAVVSFDGAHRQLLSHGEEIVITKAAEKTSFIRLDNSSFLERMHTRLGG